MVQETCVCMKRDSKQSCDICGKMCRNIKTHNIRVHGPQKVYHCEFCEKAYSGKNGLKLHVISEHGNEKHVCEICQKEYKSIIAYRSHKKVHLKDSEPKVTCKICCIEIASVSLTKHMKRHDQNHQITYPCEMCRKELTTKTNLKRHMDIHNESRPKYRCDFCQKTLLSETGLQFHLKAAH